MRFHSLRITIANWLLGSRMEWDNNGVIKSPYYELCKRLNEIRDIDLPESRRVNGSMWKRLWMERTIEVRSMHRALRRKNSQIAALKAKMGATKKGSGI